jgi:hypothetical protein
MDDAMGAAAIAEALEELRFHWGEAYEISHDARRGWHARRRDGLGDLTAPDPDGLEKAIFGDYTASPEPPS